MITAVDWQSLALNALLRPELLFMLVILTELNDLDARHPFEKKKTRICHLV